EQIDEPAGQAPQVRTTLGGKLEEARSTGGGVMDAIDGPMCAAGALVINQGLDMRRSFDLRTAIKAARVHGNDGIGIEDTHRLESREQLQAAAHVRVWGGVVVQVKAHVRCLTRVYDQVLLTGEGLGRQPEQPGLPFLEACAHAARAILGAGPIGRLERAPGERLGIEIGHVGKAAGAGSRAGTQRSPWAPSLRLRQWATAHAFARSKARTTRRWRR